MRISDWSSDVCSSDLNALKNGLLAIVISADEHQWLLDHPGTELAIDVREQFIALPDGGRTPFALEPFARHCLLNGVDQLGYLLQHRDAIARYEQQEQADRKSVVEGKSVSVRLVLGGRPIFKNTL